MTKSTVKSLQKQVEELKMEVGKLHGLVETDLLTGLYNRHGFIKRAEGFLKELWWGVDPDRKERRRLAIKDFIVVFIDLDNFKMVNDFCGHNIGDGVLKDVADILRRNTKRVDVLSRWAGDEFVVGLVGVSIVRGIKTAERIRKKFSDHKVKLGLGKDAIKISASFGVASALEIYKDFGTFDISILIEKTDEAMYKAKREYGKNFVASYHEFKKKK